MAIAITFPKQGLVGLRRAFSEWWIGRTTGGLTGLELDFLVDAVWRYWREGHEERSMLCQRHQRWTSFDLTQAHLQASGQIQFSCLEHCPGDYDLKGQHTVFPREFTVPRGRWSEICEIPLAQEA